MTWDFLRLLAAVMSRDSKKMYIETSIFKAYDIGGVVPSTLKGMSKTHTTAALGLLCCS